VLELNHPTYSGVAMGTIKEEKVAMLFSKVSKVSKRRCKQINNKMWDKVKETLDLAQSAAYTNIRGKTCVRTNSTYVGYGHHKEGKRLVTTLCCQTRRMRF
jgi:hypothetical protein